MRTDIQCLRGLAIIFVLLYHLFPTTFENGFLGVDIFFVLSGYLMAKNLMKTKIVCIEDLIKFYYRRLKRILPLYYLVIFVSLIVLHFFLCDFWWQTNYRYSFASLFLITNQLIIHDSADYFREFLADGTSLNCFIHFWSLGVEIQFYLLVPFLFFGFHILKSDFLRLIASVIMTTIGCICYSLINRQFAFNFMFLRLWQFSAGFVALFVAKTNFYEIKEYLKPSKVQRFSPWTQDDFTNVCVGIMSICLLPMKLESLAVRPLITFTTSVLLSIDNNQNKILNSSILSYFGDISYSIYLVHWPIIVMLANFTPKAKLLCLVLTLIISIIVHHSYEKVYLKLNIKAIIPLMLILILANVYLQSSVRRHEIWKFPYSPELENIVTTNRKMMQSVWETTKPKDPCEVSILEDPEIEQKIIFGYCVYPKGNGTLKVTMIGNSYVMNMAEPLRSHFKYNYTRFEYSSIGDSYGLYADTERSKLALKVSRRIVQKSKPDVLFIMPRYSSTAKDYLPEKEENKLIQEMERNIAFYENYTSKIIILGAHPLYPLNFINYFVHYATQRPNDLSTLHLNKKTADLEMKNIRRRFAAIKCKKCKFFEMGHVFLNENRYLTYDEKNMESYVDNTIHLTSSGLKVVDPVLKNITQMALDTIL